jgi:hypothetical protein
MHPASDAWRARAVEWLANLEARGGTELADALVAALGHVAGSQRRSVVVLVTDGQVADEDRLVELAQRAADNVRIHCVGIDQAVNGGLFERLARVGRGHCELVETERRLDDVLVALHRRIRSPQLSGVTLTGDGLELLGSTLTPPGVLDVFPGVPLEITGRYRGSGSIVLRATGPDGSLLERRLAPLTSKECSLGAIWGRSRIRDLEDAYAAYGDETLAATIVATSLATGVLSRHTAFVAVDEAERLANPSSDLARLVQPVPLPAGWAPMSAAGAAGAAFGKSAPSPAQSPMHAAAAMGRSGARRAQFAAAAPSPAASPQHSPVPQQPLPVAPAPLEAAPGHQLFATSLGAAAFGGPETDALLSDSFGAQPELGHGVPASGARAGAASDEELLLRARQLLETARDGKLAPLSALQTAIFYADALLARVGAGEMGCELDQALRGLVVALVEGDQARITNAAEALIALLEDPTGAATTTGGGTAFWRGRPGASAS